MRERERERDRRAQMAAKQTTVGCILFYFSFFSTVPRSRGDIEEEVILCMFSNTFEVVGGVREREREQLRERAIESRERERERVERGQRERREKNENGENLTVGGTR